MVRATQIRGALQTDKEELWKVGSKGGRRHLFRIQEDKGQANYSL